MPAPVCISTSSALAWYLLNAASSRDFLVHRCCGSFCLSSATNYLFPLQCQKLGWFCWYWLLTWGTLRKCRFTNINSHNQTSALATPCAFSSPATPLTPDLCMTFPPQHPSALLALLHWFLTRSAFCLLCILCWWLIDRLHPLVSSNTRPPSSELLIFSSTYFQMLSYFEWMWQFYEGIGKIICIHLYFI